MRLRAVIRRIFRPATTPVGAERSISALMRTWWLAAVLALVLAATLATNGFSHNAVLAGSGELAGTPVPPGDLQTIESAALSCPALTGPRLAAQLMATGGFDSGASGGKALDGLDPTQWHKWLPWPDAERTDRRANIIALAHQTCELVGEVRVAGTEGDQWLAAVAATRAGLQAVLNAKGVPADAKNFVDTVSGYADWYAQQSDFQVTPEAGGPGPQMVTPEPKPVPQEYVADILKAGRICSSVTPGQIAAQLMVASGFDPNKQSASGAQGIAQFPPEVWQQYADSPAASPWNPDSAIPALGVALCDLSAQLSALPGGDRFGLALAAFRWGTTAVREAGGIPKSATLRSDNLLAGMFANTYAADPRLRPAPAASPSPRPSASKPAAPKPPKPAPPVSKPPVDPAVPYQVTNANNGLVLDVPGDDNNPGADVIIQQWHNQRAKDQFWRVLPVGKTGYYRIINGYSGKALSVKDDSRTDGALIVQAQPGNSTSQQWQLQYAPNDAFWIVNRASGAVLDVAGDDDNFSNAGTIDQWHRQADANDQLWRFTR